MARVLMISKPVAPPWNDSSKNLVRDVASHLERHRAVILSLRDAGVQQALPGGSAVEVREIYPAHPGKLAPPLADQMRVMLELLTGAPADLWHFFFAPNKKSSRAGALAARLRRMKTVQTVCSAPRAGADLPAILFADRIVVLSRHTERRLLEGGIAKERIARIAPAVAPLDDPDEAARQRARERFGLGFDAQVVVYPGDLEFSLGAERSLRMHARSSSKDCVLVMACRRKTPAAREAEARLRGLSAQLGTAERVRWVGETSSIHALLAAADVVVLPAEDLYAKMDLPLVLIEAMMLRRSTIVLEGTAAAELCEGDAAIAVPDDEAALSSAVQDLLDDADARTRLGVRARERALSAYAPNTVARAHEALYDEILV